MDYEEIYEGFYSKYYDKIEHLIKRFFIKRQNQKKSFLNSYNEVFHYLGFDFEKKLNIFKCENLTKLHQIFYQRYTIYSSDELQGIFENEIKAEYDRIKLSELPENYNYIKFIKEVALIEVGNEISRLLSNNLKLLELFYKLNDFDGFEIRRHGNLALENYPIYKKLNSKIYQDIPCEFYIDSTENNSNKLEQDSKDYTKEVWFLVGSLIATGEMEKLLQTYKSATKVAKYLKIEKSRPYITDSKYILKSNGLQNVERNTNIYNDPSKITKLYNYCIQNKIAMTSDFVEIFRKMESN